MRAVDIMFKKFKDDIMPADVCYSLHFSGTVPLAATPLRLYLDERPQAEPAPVARSSRVDAGRVQLA
jgi:hypothetical protein